MHYTYLVECRDHTFYIGYTNDLEKRIKAHNVGTLGPGKHFTVYDYLKQELMKKRHSGRRNLFYS